MFRLLFEESQIFADGMDRPLHATEGSFAFIGVAIVSVPISVSPTAQVGNAIMMAAAVGVVVHIGVGVVIVIAEERKCVLHGFLEFQECLRHLFSRVHVRVHVQTHTHTHAHTGIIVNNLYSITIVLLCA